MNEGTSKNENHIKTLANQFMAMSQKGTVCFYEETVVEDLIDYFLGEEKEQIALELAEWAVQMHPYSSSMLHLKAEVLYQSEKYDLALEALDISTVLDTTNTDSFLLKAKILVEMGRYDQATETLYSLESGNIEKHSTSNIHLCYASIYENLERHNDMFDALCNALRVDWDNEEVLERLWLCTEFCQQHQKHIDFLQEYLDERPYSSIAWFNLGHSYWHMKDLENAAISFEYAYIIDKFFHQAYVDAAEVLSELKKHDVALSCYEDALVHYPKDGDIQVGIGNCLFMTRQYDKALNSYKKATYYAPNNAEGFYGKGICHIEMNAPKLALKAFKKAVAIDDKREEFAAALGEAYYRLGDIVAAAEAFNRAVELAPEMSEYWVRNITFLMDENRFDEALDNIQGALENTYGTELKYCQAAFYFRTGNRSEGMVNLVEAIEEDFSLFDLFTELCPKLSEDSEILALTTVYRA